MSPPSAAGAKTPAASPFDAPDALRPLAPAIRTIWTIKLTALLMLPAFGLFFYELTRWLGDGGAWPLGMLTGAAVLFALAVGFGLPRLRYRFWRFALRPEELYLERGVFNRVRTIVPLRRIQHLDVSQDLVEREFDLGRLVVHTAGGRSSDVVLPGLPFAEAERLRDDVKRYVLEDDAV